MALPGCAVCGAPCLTHKSTDGTAQSARPAEGVLVDGRSWGMPSTSLPSGALEEARPPGEPAAPWPPQMRRDPEGHTARQTLQRWGGGRRCSGTPPKRNFFFRATFCTQPVGSARSPPTSTCVPLFQHNPTSPPPPPPELHTVPLGSTEVDSGVVGCLSALHS